MSQVEFVRWVEFYKMHPFDDYHRIYRPSAMLASVHGANTQEVLDWLQPRPELEGFSESDIRTFRALGIHTMTKEK